MICLPVDEFVDLATATTVMSVRFPAAETTGAPWFIRVPYCDCCSGHSMPGKPFNWLVRYLGYPGSLFVESRAMSANAP
jgi:hypothetical protein